MSNETFLKATTEYHAMGGKNIWLNAMTGEPLLDPQFFEKTEILRSLGAFRSVNLTTNGILLAKEGMADRLIASGISHVVVSTAGFDRALYRRYMGVDRYDDFLTGLVNLLRSNLEAGTPLDITVGMRGLMDAMYTEDFRARVLPLISSSKGRVRVEFLRFYTDWVKRVKPEDLPDGCGLLPRIVVRRAPCPISFNLGILANGDMRVCNCHYGLKGQADELCIGNVMTSSISEAWRSEAAKRVMASTYGSQPNMVCRQCVLYPPYPKKA
jgi:radical SAM protein with 4Fe4S-binding SPASM domain